MQRKRGNKAEATCIYINIADVWWEKVEVEDSARARDDYFNIAVPLVGARQKLLNRLFCLLS